MVAFLFMDAADYLIQINKNENISGSFPISSMLVPMLDHYSYNSLYFIERFCWWFHIIEFYCL